MRKFFPCVSVIYLLAILTGCGNNASLTYTSDSPNGSVDMENTSTDQNDTEYNYITTTSEITKLERGFSAVRYDGDYSFDQFLEQGGGAESDQDALVVYDSFCDCRQ